MAHARHMVVHGSPGHGSRGTGTGRVVRLLAVLALVGLISFAPTVSWAQIRGLASTTRVADAAFDLELLDATATEDGASAWLLVAARPKGRRSADPVPRLLHVDGAGTQASIDLPVLKPPAGGDPFAAPGRRRIIQAVALAADGRPVLGLSRSHLPVSLLTISSSGRDVAAPVPIRLQTDADLVGLVRLSTGRLLMLGAAGLRGMVAEVAPTGAVAWEKVIPGDLPLVLDEAWPTSDGGAVLLGRSGKDAASSQLWVGTMTAKGEITSQATLPGFDGDVTRLTDGSLVLAVDSTNAALFDTQLVRLGGEKLDARSKTPLLEKQPTSGVVRLAGLPGGDLLLAGVRDRGLWITRLTAAGATVWSEFRTPAPPSLELVSALRVIPRGRTVVVPYGAYVVEGREQRQVVTVLRLTVE